MAATADDHLVADLAPTSGPLERWVDRLAGSDPGYNRLFTALRTVAGIAAILAAEWAFVHLTGALQVSAGGPISPAEAATQHHAVLVIAMLLGAVPGIIGGFAVNDPTPGGQLISLLIIPFPVIGALALGLAVGGIRPLALATFPVLMAIAGLLRRFGPRGFSTGVLFFIGDFIGFFLHGQFHLGDLGWLAAEVGGAVVTLVLVRFTLFYPARGRALRRSERSYLARARRVAALSLDILDHPSPAASRRLRRQLVRLNESALIIDAELDPGDPVLHQRLFDVEVSLTNVARFADALATGDAPVGQLRATREALEHIRAGDADGARQAAARLRASLTGALAVAAPRQADVLALRFAGSLEGFLDAVKAWHAARDPGSGAGYTSPSQLAGGWLPGSANVSADAATRRGGRGLDRLGLPINVRAGLQMGVSVGLAVVAGDALSARRFYWAVLAAFLAFTGTHFAMEQIRKALHRVAGTLVGVVVGAALVNAVGHTTDLSVVVILAALFFGIYLFRVSYAFMAFAITVAISQVYVQLAEYSASLLALRAEETAIGAAAAVLTVLIIVPVRSRRVVRIAAAEELEAIAGLVGEVPGSLRAVGDRLVLHEGARQVDVAYQALVATTRPLGWSSVGDQSEELTATKASALSARNYARNLVADVNAARSATSDEALDELARGVDQLRSSIGALVEAGDGDRSSPYVRSASLFEACALRETSDPDGALALLVRDLQLMDGSLATLARAWGLEVRSLDMGPGAQEPHSSPSPTEDDEPRTSERPEPAAPSRLGVPRDRSVALSVTIRFRRRRRR